MIRLLLLVILIVGIAAGVYLVTNQHNLFSKASSEEQIAFPQDVIITNITATSFSLSYFTPTQKVFTQIKYGKDPNNLNQTKNDDRDIINSKAEWFSHYVTLDHLEPNTQYYVKIETFGEKLKHDFITQKTGSIIVAPLPEAKSYTGSVQRTPRFGYIDTLIYLKTEKGQLLSTRPDSRGKWTFDLSRYRAKDLQSYYEVLKIDLVEMVAVVGNDGVAYLKIYSYGLDKPVLLRLGLVKVPFYGIELGSSKAPDPANTSSSSNGSNSKDEKGIIESIWLFITHWFGFS